jgi:hypothetical protein
MPRAVSHLCIHHSASSSGTVEEFDLMHRGRGFSSIGYHHVIGNGKGIPDGEIKLGRPEKIDGAGVWGNNKGKLHCCMIGQFSRAHSGYTGPPTPKQWHALGHWLLVKGATYSVPFTGIVGHKEIALKGHPTACPGDIDLKQVRLWYAANIEAARQSKPVESLADWMERHA